ncbi:MAG: hypothetical protein BAJATHORv1_30211 [Candidatus Thorarchaeota archaeon]|nr:MAG: hypothetical protein BAJATHORv1_30211 [Candidatus Thorarchaeota archaeon]
MPTLELVKKSTGFLLKYGHVRLGLDTGIKNETTLLSHSHADHIGRLDIAHRVIATQGTFDTLEARNGRADCKRTVLHYGDSTGQLGVIITAFDAGHVLGSTMFHMEFDDDLSILYTGDFNVEDSLVHKAAQAVKADVLITEATYGSPEWIFPKREETYFQILKTAQDEIARGKIPVFQAYSLGKAQEAIALLEYRDIPVVSGNGTIDTVNDAYNKHGAGLNAVSIRSGEAIDNLDEGCAIVSSSPAHTFTNIRKILGSELAREVRNRAVTYSLSGWTLGGYRGKGFPLSAHTDFPHLIEFAKKVDPRIAYVFTGNAGVLASHLHEEGITAVPLE